MDTLGTLQGVQAKFTEFRKELEKTEDAQDPKLKELAQDLTVKVNDARRALKEHSKTEKNQQIENEVSTLIKTSEEMQEQAANVISTLFGSPFLQQFSYDLREFLRRGKEVEKSHESNRDHG